MHATTQFSPHLKRFQSAITVPGIAPTQTYFLAQAKTAPIRVLHIDLDLTYMLRGAVTMSTSIATIIHIQPTASLQWPQRTANTNIVYDPPQKPDAILRYLICWLNNDQASATVAKTISKEYRERIDCDILIPVGSCIALSLGQDNTANAGQLCASGVINIAYIDMPGGKTAEALAI